MHHLELRTVPRYFLDPSLHGFASGRAIRIVDLSVKGARLEHIEPFELGDEIHLSILGSDREIVVRGTVLWCELDSLQLNHLHDRYLTGIAFRSPAVEDLLEELVAAKAAMKIEDARNFERYHLGATLTASFGPYSPVSLLDLSMRGARIETGPGLAQGHMGQLIFQVDHESGPVDVMAKVMWTAPKVDGSFHTGLLIAGADEVMSDAIHRLCRRGEAHIDLHALRRKFDSLRAEAMKREATRGAA